MQVSDIETIFDNFSGQGCHYPLSYDLSFRFTFNQLSQMIHTLQDSTELRHKAMIKTLDIACKIQSQLTIISRI